MDILSTTDTSSQIFKDALAMRKQIFVQEQQIPDVLDQDGRDERSLHLVIYDEQGETAATGRLSFEKDGTGCLSRIAVAPSRRGQQLGKKVIVTLEAKAREHGLNYLYLVPHEHLERFYQSLGYKKIPDKHEVVGDHQLIHMEKWLLEAHSLS